MSSLVDDVKVPDDVEIEVTVRRRDKDGTIISESSFPAVRSRQAAYLDLTLTWPMIRAAARNAPEPAPGEPCYYVVVPADDVQDGE